MGAGSDGSTSGVVALGSEVCLFEVLLERHPALQELASARNHGLKLGITAI